ncbi:hypothetical protein ABB37_07055 [Leptomonas pyrrhocoris]|uniref:EF-hand domain-containing protein n=1 Tax=Leptomonas pyrrhocoris TaxID=157538 RepID=A0A0M9FX42_LEPPY|nr:hypothetical protein ABB37_07055 [Leptomonas pyrrhocoris]KPA77737.1 hypothetical protein ABB37_07055 [Leptomonas pyrrhocoris]|eukprot:XP_015656176.1 hypothetical protein ABB37_07055 [Leptomonas pyrrhocoris]
MNAMYSAEQIKVPPELGTIMKQYTKAVMRDKPTDLYKYSANFFAILSGYPAPFDADGQLTESGANDVKNTSGAPPGSNSRGKAQQGDAVDPIDSLFRRYDRTGTGYMEASELPSLLEELKTVLSLDANDLDAAESIQALLPSADGQIDLLELRRMLFEEPEE